MKLFSPVFRNEPDDQLEAPLPWLRGRESLGNIEITKL